jgi:hypothetical protein
MITLGHRLNRSYSLYLPFNNDFCEISILFNKTNSFVGHNLDQKNYIKSKNGDIKVFSFFDLSTSAFATAFLDIRNFKSRNLDIQHQFHNILPEFKDNIHYETNETITLSKVVTPKGKLESCIYIYVFRLTNYGNDFIYCLVERQHIDCLLDRKIVRTSAIQISTNECYEDLISMIESSNKNMIRPESVDTVISNVFAERKSVNE